MFASINNVVPMDSYNQLYDVASDTAGHNSGAYNDFLFQSMEYTDQQYTAVVSAQHGTQIFLYNFKINDKPANLDGASGGKAGVYPVYRDFTEDDFAHFVSSSPAPAWNYPVIYNKIELKIPRTELITSFSFEYHCRGGNDYWGYPKNYLRFGGMYYYPRTQGVTQTWYNAGMTFWYSGKISATPANSGWSAYGLYSQH